MKSLARLHLVLCLIFIFGAVGIPLYLKSLVPNPPLLQTNAQFLTNVESIKDIEHLRKVLYTVVVGADKSVVAEKAAIDSTVDLLALLMAIAAAGFAYSYYVLRTLNARSESSSNGRAL